MTMDGRYAGNAGAISGEWPWMAGKPKMQEQFPAFVAAIAGACALRAPMRACENSKAKDTAS